MARGIKLKAPDGTDIANVGTTEYDADLSGNMVVDPADAETLEKAGFVEVQDEAPVKPDTSHLTTLYCEPHAACTWSGVSYADEDGDGQILVANAAVRDLLSHGFSIFPLKA